ncbi:Lrp/AsnC family transcriptional regulator, partial [Mesorhizobium sp. M7A.F.Ca.CA.004.12.1.1]
MLSDAEQALLSLLRENARASTAELARRLGVSRTTVQSRIERLEQRGIISGYGVRLAPDYEQGLVRAHV